MHSCVIREARRLLKEIEPASFVHTRKDLRALRRVAGEIGRFTSNPLVTSDEDLSRRTEVGLKGILHPRRKGKDDKLQVNIDDGYDIAY